MRTRQTGGLIINVSERKWINTRITVFSSIALLFTALEGIVMNH